MLLSASCAVDPGATHGAAAAAVSVHDVATTFVLLIVAFKVVRVRFAVASCCYDKSVSHMYLHQADSSALGSRTQPPVCMMTPLLACTLLQLYEPQQRWYIYSLLAEHALYCTMYCQPQWSGCCARHMVDTSALWPALMQAYRDLGCGWGNCGPKWPKKADTRAQLKVDKRCGPNRRPAQVLCFCLTSKTCI